jgi:hypothetical protein
MGNKSRQKMLGASYEKRMVTAVFIKLWSQEIVEHGWMLLRGSGSN